MSDEDSDHLRRHAAHCRQMAHNFVDDRTRTILLTKVGELDGQADELETRPGPGSLNGSRT